MKFLCFLQSFVAMASVATQFAGTLTFCGLKLMFSRKKVLSQCSALVYVRLGVSMVFATVSMFDLSQLNSNFLKKMTQLKSKKEKST